MYLILIFLPLMIFIIRAFTGRSLGKRGLLIFTRLSIACMLVLVHFVLYEIVQADLSVSVNRGSWIYADLFGSSWSIRYDMNSVFMTYLIVLIFSIVTAFSLWYMASDPYLIRFIATLSVFCFMMLILVLSSNLLVMRLGWEGVGITSYFLINFWYTRLQANKASIKAIVYNKVGDTGYMIAVLLLVGYCGNSTACSGRTTNNQYLFLHEWNLIVIACFMVAAVAKSAQLLRHSWRGDAMEGPTPVSALLHAATMVTAGVYLSLRVLPSLGSLMWDSNSNSNSKVGEPLTSLIPNINTISSTSTSTSINTQPIDSLSLINPGILQAVLIISVRTIVIGGMAALAQQDIKKLIAYSTMSQLGYMMLAALCGFYSSSLMHLLIHGYFKALRFLSAGIIIHTSAGLTGASLEQDIRKFGALVYTHPRAYFYCLTGSAAIVAWPLFSGFYSKDNILESSVLSWSFVYAFALGGALLTTLYSLKRLVLVFFSKPSTLPRGLTSTSTSTSTSANTNNNINQLEPEPHLWSLGVRVAGSLFLGYYSREYFLSPSLYTYSGKHPLLSYATDLEFVPFMLRYKRLPIGINRLGLGICALYLKKEIASLKWATYGNLELLTSLERALSKRWHYDAIVSHLAKKIQKVNLTKLYWALDKGWLELLGPIGSYRMLLSQHYPKLSMKHVRKKNNNILKNSAYISHLLVSLSLVVIALIL